MYSLVTTHTVNQTSTRQIQDFMARDATLSSDFWIILYIYIKERGMAKRQAAVRPGRTRSGGGIITRGPLPPPPPSRVNQCVCATRIVAESPLRTLIAGSPSPPRPLPSLPNETRVRV